MNLCVLRLLHGHSLRDHYPGCGRTETPMSIRLGCSLCHTPNADFTKDMRQVPRHCLPRSVLNEVYCCLCCPARCRCWRRLVPFIMLKAINDKQLDAWTEPSLESARVSKAVKKPTNVAAKCLLNRLIDEARRKGDRIFLCPRFQRKTKINKAYRSSRCAGPRAAAALELPLLAAQAPWAWLGDGSPS